MNLQIVLLPWLSTVDLDDMYGFAALPTAKSAGIELVC